MEGESIDYESMDYTPGWTPGEPDGESMSPFPAQDMPTTTRFVISSGDETVVVEYPDTVHFRQDSYDALNDSRRRAGAEPLEPDAYIQATMERLERLNRPPEPQKKSQSFSLVSRMVDSLVYREKRRPRTIVVREDEADDSLDSIISRHE